MTKQQEVNAILAGLRLVQQQLDPVPGGENVMDILTNEGEDAPPTVEELNTLCDALPSWVFRVRGEKGET